jgi:serine/threonine protein phosphatase 1
MGRTLAIGDIHGQLVQFDALLAAVKPKPEDRLVLLGDYVDRGPDSAGVVQRILETEKDCHVVALRGNHEEMMLGARKDPDGSAIWQHFGGREALQSYGGCVEKVPAEHWQFLERTRLCLETETHIFVHAYVVAELPLEKQPREVLLWRPFDAIRPHISGKTVVCGHTVQETGRPTNRRFAICLDTGAGFGGPLTCADMISGIYWQASNEGKVIEGNLLDFVSPPM